MKFKIMIYGSYRTHTVMINVDKNDYLNERKNFHACAVLK